MPTLPQGGPHPEVMPNGGSRVGFHGLEKGREFVVGRAGRAAESHIPGGHGVPLTVIKHFSLPQNKKKKQIKKIIIIIIYNLSLLTNTSS